MKKEIKSPSVPFFMSVHDESPLDGVMPVSGRDFVYNPAKQKSDWSGDVQARITYRKTAYGDEAQSDDLYAEPAEMVPA